MYGGGVKCLESNFGNERRRLINFGFYISGKSMRLYKFLSGMDSGEQKNIKLVISDEPIETDLKRILEAKKIAYLEKILCEIPEHTRRQKCRVFSDYMLSMLKDHQIDYVFSFGLNLLSGELLRQYEYHLINFHPSVLPMYPGKNAIDQAVAHGNTFLLGNTAHFIDEGADTGKIIMQSVIPVHAFLESGYDIVLDMQIEMLKKLIFLLENDRVQIVDDRVRIAGADYHHGMIFPLVEGDKSEVHL